MSSRTVSIVALSLALAAGLIAGYASVFSGGLPRRVIDTPPKDTSDDTDSNLLSTGNPFDKIDNRLNDLEQCCEQTETGLTDVFQSIETINENAFFACENDADCPASDVNCHQYLCASVQGVSRCILESEPAGSECQRTDVHKGQCSATGACVPCELTTDMEGMWSNVNVPGLFGYTWTFRVETVACTNTSAGIAAELFAGYPDFISENYPFIGGAFVTNNFPFGTIRNAYQVESKNVATVIGTGFFFNTTQMLYFQPESIWGVPVLTFTSSNTGAFIQGSGGQLPIAMKIPDITYDTIRKTPLDVHAQPDITKHLAMYDLWLRTYLYWDSGHRNNFVASETFTTVEDIDTHIDLFRNIGYQRDPVGVRNIRRSTAHGGLMTTLLLPHDTLVVPGDHLTVSGAIGDWAPINGVHDLFWGSADMDDLAHNKLFASQLGHPRQVSLLFNSATFPVYNDAIHGHLTVSFESIGPVRPNSEFREFVKAAMATYRQINPLGQTHGSLITFVNQNFPTYFPGVLALIVGRSAGSVPETWTNTKELISQTAGSSALRSFGSTMAGTGSHLYTTALPGFFAAENAEPAPYGPVVPGNYDVIMNNYLLAGAERYIWYRFNASSPAPVSRVQELPGIIGQLQWDCQNNVSSSLPLCAAFGFTIGNTPIESAYRWVTPSINGVLGASDIEGRVGPHYTVGETFNMDTNNPDLLTNGVPGYWSPFQFDQLGFRQNPAQKFASVIDPALTGGRKIGYIRLSDTLFDIPFGLNLLTTFNQEGHPQGNRHYFMEVLCQWVKYLNEFTWDETDTSPGVEAIIIDHRVMIGGDPMNSLFGACFGGRRSRQNRNFVVFSRPDLPPVPSANFTYFGSPFGESETWEFYNPPRFNFVDPEIAESLVPNGVFKNGTIIYINSHNARSVGDGMLRDFLGDQLDGNLGSIAPGMNVHVRILGDVYGLLQGGQTGRKAIPFDPSNTEFIDSNGIPMTPFWFANEAAGSSISDAPGAIPNAVSSRREMATGEFIKALQPVHTNTSAPFLLDDFGPSVVESHGRLRAGPVSYQFEDLTYFDFGYTGPTESNDGTKHADGHWDSVANGGPTHIGQYQITGCPGQLFPDQPTHGTTACNRASWRDSVLEEAIRMAHLVQWGNYPATTQSTQSRPLKTDPIVAPPPVDPSDISSNPFNEEPSFTENRLNTLGKELHELFTIPIPTK